MLSIPTDCSRRLEAQTRAQKLHASALSEPEALPTPEVRTQDVVSDILTHIANTKTKNMATANAARANPVKEPLEWVYNLENFFNLAYMTVLAVAAFGVAMPGALPLTLGIVAGALIILVALRLAKLAHDKHHQAPQEWSEWGRQAFNALLLSACGILMTLTATHLIALPLYVIPVLFFVGGLWTTKEVVTRIFRAANSTDFGSLVLNEEWYKLDALLTPPTKKQVLDRLYAKIDAIITLRNEKGTPLYDEKLIPLYNEAYRISEASEEDFLWEQYGLLFEKLATDTGVESAVEIFHLLAGKRNPEELIQKAQDAIKAWNRFQFVRLAQRVFSIASFALSMLGIVFTGHFAHTIDGYQNAALAAVNLIPCVVDITHPYKRNAPLSSGKLGTTRPSPEAKDPVKPMPSDSNADIYTLPSLLFQAAQLVSVL